MGDTTVVRDCDRQFSGNQQFSNIYNYLYIRFYISICDFSPSMLKFVSHKNCKFALLTLFSAAKVLWLRVKSDLMHQ